ncbi:MAG: outer membrane beta-barrel protein [Ignavibacteria bacterium]|nr:outer membrane beta-barrel protein [Ignavibacteria bacterium]
MRRQLFNALLLAISFFSIKTFAQNSESDIVYLKSGSQIKGAIISFSDSVGVKIKLNSDYTLTFPWSQIDRVQQASHDRQIVKVLTADKQKPLTESLDEKFLSPSFYIFGGIECGLGIATEPFVSTYSNLGTGTITSTQEHRSRGEGLHLDAGIGFQVYKNLGIELAFTYLTSNDISGHVSSETGDINSDIIRHNNLYTIRPSLVYNFPAVSSGLYPFAKLGLVFGFPSYTNESNGTYYDSKENHLYNIQEEDELTGDTELGYYLAIGMRYQKSMASFQCELYISGLNFQPTEYNVNKLVVDGIDEKAFLNNGHVFLRDNSVSNNQSVGLSPTNVFSHAGLRIGITLGI